MAERADASTEQLVDRDWFSLVAPVQVLSQCIEPAILDAVSPPVAETDTEVEKAHGDRWRRFLDEQKTAGSARGAPCTAVWMAGAVAYRCRTCQTGEQSSVCVRCFQAGNHEGHDYIMYRSETGGVCDCGDLESWSAHGCCDAHRPIAAAHGGTDEGADEGAESTSAFPEGTAARDVSEAMLGVAFERLLLALESVARARGPHLPPAAGARREAERKIASELLKWFLTIADCGAMRAACAAAMTRRWDAPSSDFDLRSTALVVDADAEVPHTQAPAWDNGGCPNARWTSSVTGFGGLYGQIGATTTTDAVRTELRRRRLVVKTKLGCAPTAEAGRSEDVTDTEGGVNCELPNANANAKLGDTPRGEWPLGGTEDAGLLECLLRATCLPSLPEDLAETSTTLVLTLLFNPDFKVAFSAALVRHYRDLVLYPNTLPWPGVSRMERSGLIARIVGGDSQGEIRGEMSATPISAAVTAMNVDDSDDSDDDDAATPNANGNAGLGAGAAPPNAGAGQERGTNAGAGAAARRRAARRRGIDGGTTTGRPFAGGRGAFASGAYAQRQRECISRCMDRVTVQLFGSVPIVSHSVLREGMLRELHDVIADALTAFTHRGPSLPGRPNGVVDPACEGIKTRLYMRPCNDLRMCLSQRGVARYWLAASTQKPGEDAISVRFGDQNLLKIALATLRSMQGMNPYTKKRGEHVERERSDWIHAMTAEMVLMSTLRHGAATAADGLAHERGQSKNDQTVAEDAERPADKATVDAVAALERRRGARVAEVVERRAASMRRYGLGAAARHSPSMQSLTDSLNGDTPGFPALDQTQAARYICRALRETVDVAADWAYGERARETLVNGGDSALTPSGSEDHDPERDPVSIHIPLHRFAAILVNAAFVAESVDADGSPVLDAPLTCPNLSSVLTDHPFTVQIHALAEHPIRALAWSDAVRARAWVRNGEEVRRLSSVYASRYWAGLGRDADLALLQYALASSHAPHEVATRLLDAGCRSALLPLAKNGTQEATTPRAASRGYVEGVGEAVADGEPSPTRRRTGGSRRQSTDRRRSMDTDQPDTNLISTDPHGEPSTPSDENPNSTTLRYRDPKTLRPWDLECARSASRTLVGLAKDRCWLSNNPFEISVRRELVHALAVESRTHSELSDLLPTNLASENNDVDKVLTQVAVYEPPRTLDDKGKYSLKAEMWREFDGFFHRFAPTDSESALRNAVTAYITQRKEGVAEEDCAWHPRDMLSAPHVAPPPFAGVLRFARHPSIATFVHDCVCYLREQRNEPDLQDVAVSAMAIAALALDDRVFVEHLRDVGGSLSGKSGTFPDPWARALLHGSTADSNSVDESKPAFLLALESLAAGAGGEWPAEESHFVVIVAECARELLCRLADAGLGMGEQSAAQLEAETANSPATAGRGSPDADAMAERKAKALARQKAAMAQMAARQAAFRLAATDDDDDSESESDAAGSNPADVKNASDRLPWDEKGVCGLCRGSETAGPARVDDGVTAGNGPLVWVALAQRTNAPALARRDLHARFRNLHPKPDSNTTHRPKHVTVQLETGGYVDVPLPSVDPLGHHHSVYGHGPGTPDPLPPDDPGSGETQNIDDLDARDQKARLLSIMCYDCLPAPGGPGTVEPAESPGEGGYEYARHNLADADWKADLTLGGAPLMDGEGVGVMCCGHQVHADCFDRYHASVLSRGSEAGAQRAQSGLGADDFHCPTCRRLCNAVVPVMPATPSQLRAHRDRSVPGGGSGPADVAKGLDGLNEALRDARHRALSAALLADREAAKPSHLNPMDLDDDNKDKSTDAEYVEQLADSTVPGSDSPRARSARTSRNSRSSIDGSAENTPKAVDGTVDGTKNLVTAELSHPYWSKHPGRYQVGAHLAKRLATAAREGPGTGTAESRDATHEIVAAVKELTPWSALLHGVAQCEVTSRPCEPTGEGSATDPAPPPAASAAVTGRWRALRELARLALVGDKAGNCEEGACERFGELDVLLNMLRSPTPVDTSDSIASILSVAMFASAASRTRYWREAYKAEETAPGGAGVGLADDAAPGRRNRFDVLNREIMEFAAVTREAAAANAHADEIVAAMGGAAPVQQVDAPTDAGVQADAGVQDEGFQVGLSEEAIRAMAAGEPALAQWARTLIDTMPERFDAMPVRMRNLLATFAGAGSTGVGGSAAAQVEGLNEGAGAIQSDAPSFSALELIQNDPFAFLCEVLARISRAYPGTVLCSEEHGKASQMALARAVAVVIVTQGVRAEQRASETGFAKNRDPVPVENFIAPTLWRVEALLDLMDGAAAPPPRINPRVDVARVLTHLGFKGSDDVADDAAGCVAAAKMSIDGSDDEAVMFTWTSHMGLWCHGTRLFGESYYAEDMAPRWGDDDTLEPKNPGDAELRSAVNHKRPGLIRLPNRCEDLYLSLMNTDCKRCQKPPRDPALCLACGELCCCAGACCRRGRHGECAQHAAVCGGGVGVFLLVKSTKILLIRGKRICLYPSVYLDQHGEEDELLKRGRPLFLSERRYRALEDLWVNGALDYDTLALHTSRVGSDFY